MKQNKHDRILLAHGGGGKLSDELIRKYMPVPTLDLKPLEEFYTKAGDAGIVRGFVWGDQAGCWQHAACLMDITELILKAMDDPAWVHQLLKILLDKKLHTKTVEAGAADQLFINTAGIGTMLDGVDLGFERISAGDKIILSGTIGDHGMTIMSLREDIKFKSQMKSDCAAIANLTCKLLKNSDGIKFMRDPTRGGLAATLNEISKQTRLTVQISEADIPVNPTVRAAADMLGFDVLNIANEGKFVAVVSPDCADDCLNICRNHPLGKQAALIGQITETTDLPLVEMATKIGGKRVVQMPYGRELPRIC